MGALTNNVTIPFNRKAAVSMEADKILCIYERPSVTPYPRARMIDMSGGTPSEGAEATIEEVQSSIDSPYNLAAMSSTVAVCAYWNTSGQGRVCALSVSGTTVTVGTPVNTTSLVEPEGIAKVSETRFVVSFRDETFETFDIEGTTVTPNNDSTAFTTASATRFPGNPVVQQEGVYGFVVYETSGEIKTFFAHNMIPELRLLSATADLDYLYAAYVSNAGLEVRTIAHSDLTETVAATSTVFGVVDAADIPDVDNDFTGTRKLAVAAAVASPGTVYAFGLDGLGGHVYRSDDQGATWTDISDGSWTSGMICMALEISPFDANDLVALFDNNDIYHTIDGGSTWTKTGDSPRTEIVAAERSPILESALMVGDYGGNNTDLSVNYGASWTSASSGETLARIVKAL